MNLKEAKNIHFIGIGGIGTSGLAQILKEYGKNITGSDSQSSEITNHLSKRKIKIFTPQSPENINSKIDLIIFSQAILPSNAERKAAKKLNIPTISYPEALGQLSENHFTIAIAGTHGKSTTTAMTALTAIQGKIDPTVIVGTKLRELDNQNYRIGKSKIFIVEACEYKSSFLHLHPNILIITNIEADHLDYFKTEERYLEVFKKLLKKLSSNDTIIINSDDKNSLNLSKYTKAKILISNPKTTKLKLTPGVIGDFNLKNAHQAAITAQQLGVADTIIKKSISSYKGSWRRMEEKTIKLRKTRFIDDYAHHPTEIKITLEAVRTANPKAKILCIFQPHQFSRTKSFLKEFAKSFNHANQVIIPNIYQVRDTAADLKGLSTDILVKEISKHHKSATNGQGLENTAEYIKSHYKNFDIIITMGAGDITNIYKLLR